MLKKSWHVIAVRACDKNAKEKDQPPKKMTSLVKQISPVWLNCLFVWHSRYSVAFEFTCLSFSLSLATTVKLHQKLKKKLVTPEMLS